MLLRETQARCIIGEDGNKLKWSCPDHGVHINVLHECCPMSTEGLSRLVARRGASLSVSSSCSELLVFNFFMFSVFTGCLFNFICAA